MVVPTSDSAGGSDKPVVLVIGHKDVDLDEMVQCICRLDQLEPTIHTPGLKGVPYTLNNKYFTADLEMIMAGTPEDVDDELWERVDGVVAFYRARNDETHSFLEPWIGAIEERSPEVLLCVGVHDLGTSAGNDFQVSEKVVEWCVDNQFEHVELWDRVFASPDAGIGSIHDDKVGIDRIVEALNANMWSHMVMKEDRGSALEGDRTDGPAAGVNGSTQTARAEERERDTEAGATSTAAPAGAPGEPDPLAGFLSPEELDMLSHGLFRAVNTDPDNYDEEDDLGFERAFQMLASLKDRAQGMPDEQRRLVAERVALTFQAAMGGDSDDSEGEM